MNYELRNIKKKKKYNPSPDQLCVAQLGKQA